MTALGIMSGTSRDGVDAAILRTDGVEISAFGPSISVPYEPDFRRKLSDLINGFGDERRVEDELTRIHAQVILRLLEENSVSSSNIDIIGFHGHTTLHAPERHLTRQIGDGLLLAELTDIAVVNDLRGADVAAGGEGAPLAPAYHLALARDLPKPLAVLNLGGVANVTWIGAEEGGPDSKAGGGEMMPPIMAFDTGPGNALLDDWIAAHTGERFDRGGTLASSGTSHSPTLEALMEHPYFEVVPPKSLDRDEFSLEILRDISLEDGAATLVEFTVQSVLRSLEHFPRKPSLWLVTGGGRHNTSIMNRLASVMGTDVKPVEDVGWDGDVLEAQAFGFLAVRSVRGLPLSWPSTTGVPGPCTGGQMHRPSNRAQCA